MFQYVSMFRGFFLIKYFLLMYLEIVLVAPNGVSTSIRDKLINYQAHCKKVDCLGKA